MVWNHKGRMPSVFNQLLEMERSLNNFMLETVLKMSTLTQTKVFLLLESKHYRRYAGNHDLVLCFENSNFKLESGARQIDMEVELDKEANMLREKRKRHINKRGPAKPRDSSKPRGGGGGGWGGGGRNARYDDDEDAPSPPKRPRVVVDNGIHESVELFDSTTDDPNEPPLVKREEEEEEEEETRFTDAQVNEVFDHLEKSQRSANGEKLSPRTGHLRASWEEEEDGDAYGGGDSDLEEERVSEIPFESGMYSLERIASSRKYQTLTKIEDVSRAFLKGTWEFGLLGSTMYDIGKELAIKCPIDDVATNRLQVKEYLNTNMAAYLQLFSRFTIVEKTEPFKGALRSYLPESYMRGRIRGGFKRLRPEYYRTKEEKQQSKAPQKAIKAAGENTPGSNPRPVPQAFPRNR